MKNRISDVQIWSLISDCYNNAINQNIKEKLYPLVLYIRGNQKRLRQLYTDAVDGFLETYNQHFIPLEKIFKFEQAKISKTISEYENVLEGKKEESVQPIPTQAYQNPQGYTDNYNIIRA